MKKLLIYITLIFLSSQGIAQSDIKKDWETYNVIETDSFTTVNLWQNSLDFLQNNEGCALVSQDSLNSVKATCGFWTYKSKFLKSIEGRIYFNFLIEVKDNKYRYYINDFHFLPYTRNRYGRYEAQKGETKSLADIDISKTKAWKGYQDEAKEHATTIAELLEAAMKKLPERKPETPSSSEW